MNEPFELDDKLYRSLFEHTVDGIFVISLDLKIAAVNRKGAAMLGYKIDELIGMRMANIVALEERMDDPNSIGLPLGEQYPVYERIYRRKDRTTFPVEISISIVYSELGNPLFIQNNVRDITERKLLYSRLQANESRLRAIVEAFPDLVIRFDAAGTVLDLSVVETHPLYLPNEEVVGKNISDLWPQLDEGKLLENVASLRSRSPSQVYETKFSAAGHHYEIRINPIASNECIAIVREISERIRLEKMKSDFINYASHELRTPVATANLMADLIQKGEHPEKIDEYWTVLKNELSRQKHLIDRLLLAGRLEDKKLILENNPVEMRPVLQESIAAIYPLADGRDIQIQLTTNGPEATVLGDYQGLVQVFINLINNSVKFSPPGSVIKVMMDNDGDTTGGRIIDQGMGIPNKDLPHLFERFFRARNVTVADIPGSGIGLYLVHSIIKELGGDLSATSKEGEGSTFFVQIPTHIPK